MDTYLSVSSEDMCAEFRKIVGDPIFDLYDGDNIVLADSIFSDGAFREAIVLAICFLFGEDHDCMNTDLYWRFEECIIN